MLKGNSYKSTYRLVIFILDLIFQTEISKSLIFSEYYNIIRSSSPKYGRMSKSVVRKMAQFCPIPNRAPWQSTEVFRWKMKGTLRLAIVYDLNCTKAFSENKIYLYFYTHSLFMFWFYKQDCPVHNKKDSQIFFKLHVLH